MSKQPRLRDKLSHGKVKLGKDTPRWVFVPDWTRETDTSVAWSALIRSGDVNVCRVSNDGVGGDNRYEVISPELMDFLAVDAAKAYPVGFSMALDGFVADLWRASLEVQIGGDAAAHKWVFDSLAVHGWKKRAETVADPNVWVKDGVRLSVYPARTRGNFQVSYFKTDFHWNKLMDTTELSKLIER